MKYYHILISFILISFIQFTCTGKEVDVWLLEWHFLNIADTTASIKNPKCNIAVQWKLPSSAGGTLDSNGHYAASIMIEGSKKDIDEFPSEAKLHIKPKFFS